MFDLRVICNGDNFSPDGPDPFFCEKRSQIELLARVYGGNVTSDGTIEFYKKENLFSFFEALSEL